MDKDKFNAVCEYFSDQNIQIPTEVKNAIEDVFAENDSIDSVECYHKEDLEQFQDDLTLHNDVKIYLSGKSSGVLNDVWTYYGNASYNFSEDIVLVNDNDEVLEAVSRTDKDDSDPTTVYVPTDWVVVLFEKTTWNSEDQSHVKTPVLYIYCPESSVEEEDDEYTDIYNDIKNGEL